MAELIRELENAAEVLLAPPNIINSEQRHCAEAVFLNFQKTKSPFQLCQFILGNCKSDYVQFQAATLLKHAVIREWKQIPKPEIDQLRNGLLNFAVQNSGLQSYVREQLLLVVAVMVKRASVEEEGATVVGEFLTDVAPLISSGDSTMQTIGCSILTALLNEFASSTRATDVGLTWEAHLNAKRKFQRTDLKQLFQFTLQGLSELNKIGTPIPSETAKLFKKFLMIAEQVLIWNFYFAMMLPKKLVGIFESRESPAFRPNIEWRGLVLDPNFLQLFFKVVPRKLVAIFESAESPALRPNIEWHDVFLDPNVMQLFFKLHWQVRENPDLCHHTLQCFHQLASLNGNILHKKEDRLNYLGWFLENLLQLLTSGPLKDYEAIGISNMISRLHVFFPAQFITAVQSNIVQAYLVELTNLTCVLAERAAQEEVLQDDKVHMEAFDHILEAWSSISDNLHFPEEIIKQSAVQIFNQYLKCHLSPPDGCRAVNLGKTEEIDEIEEDDRVKYNNQLTIMGTFGRMVPEHCIPILIRILEDRITRLHGQLQRIHQQSGTANDTTILEFLNEDIHWLVMVAGHVLTTVSGGETIMIPYKIIRYCLSQIESINMETTLNVLVSPSHRVTDIPNAEISTDPVVRLIAAVFRLCEVEKRALEANLIHLMSPEVALTNIWFLGRFALTYLLPNESYYSEMSLTLTQAFGKDTEAGLWSLEYLIGKFESNISLWQSESKVIIDSAQTLSFVLNNTERGGKAMSCTSLISLVKKQSAGVYQSLPTAAKRALLKALVIVGTASKQEGVKDQYWEELLKPLQEKFQSVVCCQAFAQTYHTKQVQMEVVDLIECLTGVVDGCTLANLSNLLPVINPLFEEIVKLVDLYHNYSLIVSSIFQVFCVAAKRILCYLNQVDAKKLYECCVNIIRLYAKHNVGKTSGEAGNEEEQHQDLLVLMQLLTDLMFKDFIDFDRAGNYQRSLVAGEEPTSSADVVLFGLGIIMRVLNSELLNFPNLCVQYYKLITLVSEIHASKVIQLPEDLFASLMSSVQYGLTGYTSEITALCLDFLSSLGSYLFRSQQQQSPAFAALEPFVKVVLDMLLQQPIEDDVIHVASNTVHMLICCFQSRYKELVEELIHSQPDPATAQRLLSAFSALSENMVFTLDRISRIKFREDFERFVTDVRGFLFVK